MTTTLNSEAVLRSEALSVLSDFYKDVHGVRPILSSYDHLTIDEIYTECDKYNAEAYDNMIREEIQAEADAYTFQALIANTIQMGASDEKTALKWIWDGYHGADEEVEIDSVSIDLFLWYYGIIHTPYGREIKEKMLFYSNIF